jgi:solute:Na+ symporter, SSS family
VLTTFLGPQTDRQTLIAFYRKIKPFGPGWRAIRLEAGVTEEQARSNRENIPLALLGWTAGCTVIWSGLFTVGNFLYGRMNMAALLLGVFVVGSLVLIFVINKLWGGNAIAPEAPQPPPRSKRASEVTNAAALNRSKLEIR